MSTEEHNFLDFGQSRKRKLGMLSNKRLSPVLNTFRSFGNATNNKQSEMPNYVIYYYYFFSFLTYFKG